MVKKLTRAGLRRAFRKRAVELADELVDELIDLVDEQGLWDDGEDVEEPEDRRARRSSAALEVVMKQICGALKQHREAVPIGVVAEALGTTSRRLTHPMGLLVLEGRVSRTGERRGARYRLVAKRTRKPRKKR